MGCGDGSDRTQNQSAVGQSCQIAIPAELAGGISESPYIAMCLHTQGAFGVTVEGECAKIERDPGRPIWTAMECFGPLGLPISDTQLCSLGMSLPGKLDVASKTMTGLGASRWMLAKAMVRPMNSPASLVVFHDQGLFRFCVEDGSYEKLSSSRWSLLKAAVHDPESDTAFAFHDWGLYRVNLQDGSHTRIGVDKWKLAKSAVWTPEGIVVFHDRGIYRVNAADGTSAQISGERWSQTKVAVDAGDGSALLFHGHGLYKVRLDDGAYSKVEDSGRWAMTHGAWPLTSNSRAVSRPVQQGGGGS